MIFSGFHEQSITAIKTAALDTAIFDRDSHHLLGVRAGIFSSGGVDVSASDQ